MGKFDYHSIKKAQVEKDEKAKAEKMEEKLKTDFSEAETEILKT